MNAFEVLVEGLEVFFGLAVAVSGLLVVGRSKAAAGFVALAGLGHLLAQAVIFSLESIARSAHVTPAAMQLLYAVAWFGRDVVFYGGLALALRSLALATPERPR